ncbi:MAG: hypothetical protein A3K19_24560 [Lentisphaerae bacterium RIFOXYB12_FULL_65_16]|nr:MAG: hypothetical protein A3K18_17395 [Lentisphaerae bacterium RIFOXYA12_64_32]OGV83983.1 MAG: hypothetical protein A3K19_24560 [Lentisphaerae bacterium RIFOXYB12_FULL_65_16]
MHRLMTAPVLSVVTESGPVALAKAGTAKWSGGGLELTLRLSRMPVWDAQRLRPRLRNCGAAPVVLESVEVLRVPVTRPRRGPSRGRGPGPAAGSDEVRFLRFGLNMPGDPVRFGVLSPQGIRPAPVPADGLWCTVTPECAGVTANTLLAFRAAGPDAKACVIGAETFNLTEGTATLSAVPATGVTELSYSMVLDGLILEPDAELVLDSVLILEGPDLNELLVVWAQSAAVSTPPRMPAAIPTGWNDWQFYRNSKTQQDVLDSAEELARLRTAGYPLDFVQVDGGFCLHLSEWGAPGPGFPDGIAALSAKVRALGLKFGLWLAPYIQNTATSVVQQHPDWLLQRRDGAGPVRFERSNVGASCLIDYTVPGTLDWLREQIRLFVDTWQVTWIKLDGPNYAMYRQGRPRDRHQTLHQMLAASFRVMREAAGNDVLIEGEGPMGLALGHVELQRVQTDNHAMWYRDQKSNNPYAPRVYGKELIMSFLHNRWWCNHRENVILRDFPSPFCGAREAQPDVVEPLFNENEMQTQLAAAVLGSGGLLLTDPMKELARQPERMRWISRLLPVWPDAATMVDPFPDSAYPAAYALRIRREFEEYTVLGVINWSDTVMDWRCPLDRVLPSETAGREHWAFSYFEGRLLGKVHGELALTGIPAHGVRLVALRPCARHPQLVSTSLHLLQGAVDVANVRWSQKTRCLTVDVGHFHQTDERLYFAAAPDWRLAHIKTDAARCAVDDYDPTAPAVRFDGAPTGTTRFELEWERTGRGT